MSQRRDSETSKLLISEPPLLVLPSLAMRVGLNEAIFLQQLHYWLLQSGKEREGRLWVYNTYDEWQKQLPFWSIRTIRRIVSDLKDRELILTTTKYNFRKIDQTLWYSLDYRHLDRLSETADHVDNLATWSGQSEQVDVDNLATSVTETTQETAAEKSNIRKLHTIEKYDGDRLSLLPYAEDLAREMNDQAPLSSTTTRLVNLYKGSGVDLDTFLDRLMQARAITQERTASIRTQSNSLRAKPKMAYLMSVLKDLLSEEAS